MKVFSNRSLLITRPLQDSVVLSEQIKKLDATINVICSPLFEIENLTINYDLSRINGLIITSANAVRSLERSKVKFDGPMFCVGNSTAFLAKRAGYRSVSSNGNTSQLFELIKNSVSGNYEKLIYFRGEEIIGDLGAALRAKSYNVEEVICYRKLPNDFSKNTIDGIKDNLIIGATFFSKETVRLFYGQVKYIPDDFVAFCISKEVSKTILAFYPKSPISVRVAKEPTMCEMCKLIVAAQEFAV